MTESRPLVEVKNLVKHFPVMRGILIQRQVGTVRAVDGISFSIKSWRNPRAWSVKVDVERQLPGALCLVCIRPPMARS